MSSTAQDTIKLANEAVKSYEEKKHQIDEFREISDRLQAVKDEYAQICRGVNEKNKELRLVQSAINSHDYTLLKKDEEWEKKNAERIRVLETKQAEVEKSAQEYQELLKFERIKLHELESKLSQLEKDKLMYVADNKKWEILVATTISEAEKREADVKQREQLLAEEKVQFEAYKESIKPELEEVSRLKNENIILLNKLEAKTSLLDKEEQHIAHQKEKMQLEIDKEWEVVKKAKLLIAQQQENMAIREQELADYALEVKAKDAEVMKARKRYELNEKIKEMPNA